MIFSAFSANSAVNYYKNRSQVGSYLGNEHLKRGLRIFNAFFVLNLVLNLNLNLNLNLER